LASLIADLAEMQSKLPIIAANGRLVIRDKSAEQKIIQNTPYPMWADINEAITPILGTYGFSLWFTMAMAADGKIAITCVLSHRGGHHQDTTLAFPYDSTGSKNNIQSMGSSISYGKRYTASALLNLSSRALIDADDDHFRHSAARR
jgi:hypothetical protein